MKTRKLVLAGGELVIGPMLAATIRDHKEAIGLSRRGELEPPELLELTCVLAQACAARVDPSVTLADVERLIDLDNFSAVYLACWGLSAPEVPPGEAVAGSPST